MAVRPTRVFATLLAAIVIVAGVVGLAGVSATGAVRTPQGFPGDTIVEVTGDKANGFEIRHLDGSGLFPPTDSEARAECSAYDTRVARVRCRTEVRTWYRDLADLRQALEYAHAP